MALQDLIRLILPREDRFYELIERQMDVALRASRALAEFRDPACTPAMLAASLQKLEHEGDALVHEIEELLAKTFVTPIDREDIHRLSNDLDNVIDMMNLAARSCNLLGVERPTKPMVALMDTLLECTRLLTTAVAHLRKRAYGHMSDVTRTIRRLEKEGDSVFRGALTSLFHDAAIDAKQLLREKEVLEDLEQAIDHCDHVAETLGNLAIKHG